MKALQFATEKELAWIRENEEQLANDYAIYINEMRDSMSHKLFMLNNDECFFEWCLDRYTTD